MMPSPRSPAAVPGTVAASLLHAPFPPFLGVWRFVSTHGRHASWTQRFRWRAWLLLQAVQPLLLVVTILGTLALCGLGAGALLGLGTGLLEALNVGEWSVLLVLFAFGIWLVAAAFGSRWAFGDWKTRVVYRRRRLLVDVHNTLPGTDLPIPSSPHASGQGWRVVCLVTGCFSLLFLPTLVPNVFQLPCEHRAKEAARGLKEIADAQRTFRDRTQRFGSLGELLASHSLAHDPNQGARHYAFVVTTPAGSYTALAVDKRARVNQDHPLDAWISTGASPEPTRYLQACRE
jgi:hypothetical protein